MTPDELAAALVEIDSRNPTLVPGAPGEGGIARFLADVLRGWGMRVDVTEVAPGRSNVVARAGRAEPGFGRLLLNGHLDVVGTEGMRHPPFVAARRDGRLHGRGSADMKGGLAAMCVAARDAAAAGLAGEVVVAAVADEEYESLGTRSLLAGGLRADAAVIPEPTRLAIAPAHRGFAWITLEVRGRAAHGARYDLGIDAITHAGYILAELDRWQAATLGDRIHPLLGRGSLHASRISGGTGFNTYPDHCTVGLERRTLPGDTGERFVREVEEACARVRAEIPMLDVAISSVGGQPASDVAPDAPIVRALGLALTGSGLPAVVEGMSAWTDAALLNAAGIPTVCFGPGDIAVAHADEEFVPLDDIESATAVLTTLVRQWCNAPAP